MVLIGKRKYKYGRMFLSHMVSDDINELHSMAARIGVDKKHFQNSKRPHYDICQEKKKLALLYGANEVDDRTIVTLFSQTKL